jgi:hypothetical protein
MLEEYINSFTSIEDAKTNQSFLDELDRLEEEGRQTEKIEKLYDVLDALLFIEGDEDRINALYGTILELAFDHVANAIEAERHFDLNDLADHYSARALYEHAIEHYSNDNIHEAKDLFLTLAMLSEYAPFVGAMQIHFVAAATHVKFSKFLREFVDQEAVKEEEGTAFIMHFKDHAGAYLQEHKDVVQTAVKKTMMSAQ